MRFLRRTRNHPSIVVALLLAAAIGCGDDEDNPANASSAQGSSTGAGASSGSGGSGAAGATGGGGSGSGGEGATGAVGGAGAEGGGPQGGAGGEGGAASGCVVHVNGASGDDAASGLSWASARATVGAGIETATALGCEVWVAAGVYRPTSTTDRTAAIALAPGIAVYGGFAGGEGSLDERDVLANETILSGDIGLAGSHLDNSYHVVVGADGARLDGFTIRDGFADGPLDDGKGGGLFTTAGDLTVASCRFEDNATGDDLAGGVGSIGNNGGPGGAIYHGTGALTVESSVFSDNRTGNGGDGSAIGGNGGFGAAIACEKCSLAVSDSLFTANLTGGGGDSLAVGGGIGGLGGAGAGIGFLSNESLSIVGCAFSSNATGPGGGRVVGGGIAGGGGDGAGVSVFGAGATVLVSSSTFDGNLTGNGGVATSATTLGGFGGLGAGLAVSGDVALRIEDSDFSGNLAGQGGPTPNISGPGGLGGAISLAMGAAGVVIVRSTFDANEAGIGGVSSSLPGNASPGGAIRVRLTGAGGFTLASSTFTGNEAGEGGAIYLSTEQGAGSGSVTISNCVFAGNTATANGGALSYHGDGSGDLTVASSTFAGNTATFSGGAVLYGSSQEAGASATRLVNSILWGNDATESSEIATIGVLGTPLPLQVDHADIQGGCIASAMITCGAANVDVDPQLTNSGLGDLTLLPSSPVIDQGEVTALPADAADLDVDGDTVEPTPLDRAGNARVAGSSIDLGAYELP